MQIKKSQINIILVYIILIISFPSLSSSLAQILAFPLPTLRVNTSYEISYC